MRETDAIASTDRVTAAALCMTVTGWALIWAEAVSIVPRVLLWLGVALFVCGLALIPLRKRLGAGRRQPETKTT